MRKLRRSLPLLSLALLFACAEPSSLDRAELSLRLGLAASEADFGLISINQPGANQDLEVSGRSGSIRFAVRAGLRTTIGGTFLDVGVGTLSAWDGATASVPRAGQNSIDLALDPAPSRTLTIDPIFDDGTGLPIDFQLTLVDDLTGFRIPDFGTTRQLLTLPADRPLTIEATEPLTSTLVSLPLPANSAVSTFQLPVGPVPPLPAGGFLLEATGESSPSAALPTGGPLALECAVSADCASATGWAPCDDAVTLPFERDELVQVRYAAAPTAGCSTVTIRRDSQAPDAQLRFDPPYLLPGEPTTVQVILEADEALDAATFFVRARGGTGTLCGAVTQPSPARLECPIDVAALNAPVQLEAGAADSAGNSFVIPRFFGRVAAAGAGDTVRIAAIEALRPLARADGQAIIFAIDVVSLNTTEELCLTVDPSTSVVRAPSGTDADLIVSNPTYGTAQPLVGQPTPVRMWAAVSSDSIEVGVHELEVHVGWEATFNCTYSGTPVVVTAPFNILEGSPTFSTGETLRFPDVPGQAGYAFDLPYRGRANAATLSSSDTGVVVANGDGPELAGPGTAFLTISAPTPAVPQNIEIRVDPSNTLLVLTSSEVLELRRPGQNAAINTATPVDAGIGASRKLLWEASRDATFVIGNSGVQRIGTGGWVTPTPCGATQILDAVLTGQAPGHSRAAPDLALLVNAGGLRHCELDADTGAVRLDVLPGSTACATAAHLTVDPQSGIFTALGTQCRSRWRTNSGALVNIDSSAETFGPSAIRQIEHDPIGGYAVTLDNTGNASAWTLKSSPFPRTAIYDVPGVTGPVTAIAYDAAAATPILVGAQDRTSDTELSVWRFLGWKADSTAADSSNATVFTPQGLRLGAATFDSGGRTLYLATSESTPRLLISRLGPSFGIKSTSLVAVGALPAGGTVADLAIAGPQVFGLDPVVAQPGGIATLYGLGLAGIPGVSTADEVYVGGLRASVRSFTARSITFEVPRAFARLSETQGGFSAPVTVRSHGRMSPPAPEALLIRAERRYAELGTTAVGPSACIDTCEPGIYVPTREGRAWLVHTTLSQDIVADFFVAPLVQGTAPARFVVTPPQHTLVGPQAVASIFIDQPIATAAAISAPSHTAALTASPGTLGAMAAASDGERIAVVQDGNIQLYWSRALHADRNIATVFGPTHLAFFPEGTALLAAAGDQLAAFDTTSGAGLAVNLDTSNCPAESTTLIRGLVANTGPAGGIYLLREHASVPKKTSATLVVATSPTTFAGGCLSTLSGDTVGAVLVPGSDLIAVVDLTLQRLIVAAPADLGTPRGAVSTGALSVFTGPFFERDGVSLYLDRGGPGLTSTFVRSTP